MFVCLDQEAGGVFVYVPSIAGGDLFLHGIHILFLYYNNSVDKYILIDRREEVRGAICLALMTA